MNIDNNTMKKINHCKNELSTHFKKSHDINQLINTCFKQIAPFWPLKNLIAVNPLQGFEDLPIEEALKIGSDLFEKKDIPSEVKEINQHTIKWLQIYFDEGQATITMPLKENGLYTAWKQLVTHDITIHHKNKKKIEWIYNLPDNPEECINNIIKELAIESANLNIFFTLILTTLPGWASYIKYQSEWKGLQNVYATKTLQIDYFAVRLAITYLIWPEANNFIDWYQNNFHSKTKLNSYIDKIEKAENQYHPALLKKIVENKSTNIPESPKAQFVFCIDVRSEPFRQAIESVGNYHTFGFAGFFGIPIQIENVITKESYPSCPVLISPKHNIQECYSTQSEGHQAEESYNKFSKIKKIYQSMKYNFTTPFGLVEMFGIFYAVLMLLRTFHKKIKFQPSKGKPTFNIDSMSFEDKFSYAYQTLNMIGLTQHFSPIIVLCGHDSTTENNAYASALDCGACGGRQGGNNARILALILNDPQVRKELMKNDISIPETTRFIAGSHNTTTDELTLDDCDTTNDIVELKSDIQKARDINTSVRIKNLEKKPTHLNASFATWLRSKDWSQVRAEWGLANNAAFIVGPRDLTSGLDLQGRCFLHSYEHSIDHDGSLLATILTAPMVVAQWINTQYLFSTLNNVAYDSGSKITQNITGKIGIMQGNASDLMTGLPLQSVYLNDKKPYHEVNRLMTVVFAPKELVNKIILHQPVLKKLFGNGWVKLSLIEPESRKIYNLKRDFSWQAL